MVVLVNRKDKEIYLFDGFLKKLRPSRFPFLKPFCIRKLIYGILTTLGQKFRKIFIKYEKLKRGKRVNNCLRLALNFIEVPSCNENPVATIKAEIAKRVYYELKR